MATRAARGLRAHEEETAMTRRIAGSIAAIVILLAAAGMRARAASLFSRAFFVSAVPETFPKSFSPEEAFRRAVRSKDKAALARLLDEDFSWTDSHGRVLTKAEALKSLPAPAIGEENQTGSEDHFMNRELLIHRAARGNAFLLRVWAKRGNDWRVLVYQEVVTQAAPPQSDPGNASCENPCKNVPFIPKSEAERSVIEAYQSVERAVIAHDSAAWGAHIDDAFFAVTSNSDRPLDKRTRMEGLDRQKEGGIAPFPLISARMFQFGDAMVMISRQQPAHGKAIHVTRIWTKKQGSWLEVFSYQTTIEE